MAPLGAISSLATGSSAIANSVNKKKTEDKKFRKGEDIIKQRKRKFFSEKSGNGLHLKPFMRNKVPQKKKNNK